MILQQLTCRPEGMLQLIDTVTQILAVVRTLTPGDSYDLRQQLAAISLAVQDGTRRLREGTARLQAALLP